LLLLTGPPARAQRPTKLPSARPAPPEASARPLPPRQLEEALRLLLRADSIQQRAAHPDPEATGLVLDQTLSKLGRDFYELFYGTFQAQAAGLGDYTLVVSERPLRGNASLVALSLNDNELLEMPLPTRADQLEASVAYAVETARDYLLEQQRISTQLEAGPRSPP